MPRLQGPGGREEAPAAAQDAPSLREGTAPWLPLPPLSFLRGRGTRELRGLRAWSQHRPAHGALCHVSGKV